MNLPTYKIDRLIEHGFTTAPTQYRLYDYALFKILCSDW